MRELLDGLGLGFEERAPSPAAVDAYRRAAIVLAGPHFLLDRLEDTEATRPAVRIAVLEGEARTLRAMLIRGGVEWSVRRPFHPAALRLLLLHCIYQGPEKRRAKRVSVGAAVRIQTGWRKRGALLADLSERDCRVLCERPARVGRPIKLQLPAELMGRRSLLLGGKVARSTGEPDSDGSHDVCIVFDGLSESERLRLKELLERHQKGPAVLSGPQFRHQRRARASDPPATPERGGRSVIRFEAPAAARADDPEPGAAGPAADDRRRDPRHRFRRRVIALSEEATRVLVGRDISLRGMRVDPTGSLELGQALRIAIHVPLRDTPLVVRVRVERDDGEHGLVLGFLDLSPTALRYLEEMLQGLGGAAASDGAALVSEIVEEARPAGGGPERR